jgi:anti-sigma-K factor RskA
VNPIQCKRFEVEIVDHLLGNLPLHKAKNLEHHLAECKSCQKLYDEWQQILNEKENINAVPSARLYQRLNSARLRRQFKRKLMRPSFLGGAAALAMVLVLVIGISTLQGKRSLDSWERLPLTSDNIPPFVTNDTQTVQYVIEPRKGYLTDIHGIIWVNGYRDEAYFFVHNLEKSGDQDYQIWLIKPVTRENGGLLQVKGKYGELYLQQRNIQEVQQISISLEPKGGSLYPTSGDTILVDLNLKQ